jgi:hypothetical protein
MSETVDEAKRETATDVLIRVLEYFSEDEPVDVLVVYSDKGGRVWIQDNAVDQLRAFGILEVAKNGLYNQEDETEDRQ